MDVAPGSQFDIAGYEIPDLSTIDFTDKSSHVPLIIIINAVFMSLIVVLVSAKIYARTVLANRFQTDDALIIAATVRWEIFALAEPANLARDSFYAF